MQDDKLTKIFDATSTAILGRLEAEDVSASDIKVAIELLKNMTYEALPLPGSQLEKVEEALESYPSFAS